MSRTRAASALFPASGVRPNSSVPEVSESPQVPRGGCRQDASRGRRFVLIYIYILWFYIYIYMVLE